jgi:hypothetical protein
MLGTLYETDNLTFLECPLTRMGFRGSRVQIPPSRLVKESALQRLPLWGYFFALPRAVSNAGVLPPAGRENGGAGLRPSASRFARTVLSC